MHLVKPIRLKEFVFGGVTHVVNGKRLTKFTATPNDDILYDGHVVLWLHKGEPTAAVVTATNVLLIPEKGSERSEWLQGVPEVRVVSENGVTGEYGAHKATMQIKKRPGRPRKNA